MRYILRYANLRERSCRYIREPDPRQSPFLHPLVLNTSISLRWEQLFGQSYKASHFTARNSTLRTVL